MWKWWKFLAELSVDSEGNAWESAQFQRKIPRKVACQGTLLWRPSFRILEAEVSSSCGGETDSSAHARFAWRSYVLVVRYSVTRTLILNVGRLNQLFALACVAWCESWRRLFYSHTLCCFWLEMRTAQPVGTFSSIFDMCSIFSHFVLQPLQVIFILSANVIYANLRPLLGFNSETINRAGSCWILQHKLPNISINFHFNSLGQKQIMVVLLSVGKTALDTYANCSFKGQLVLFIYSPIKSTYKNPIYNWWISRP